MSNFYDRLRGLEELLDPATRIDPRTRLQGLEDTQRAMLDAEAAVKVQRASAMREFVKQVGSATKAAEALGLSRARIYQIMGKDA